MTDILFDAGGDLLIQAGDLVVGDATEQRQYDLVYAGKAWYHHDPTAGVGITTYLNDATLMPGLTGLIRRELQRDGQTVERVKVLAGGKVQIEGRYD